MRSFYKAAEFYHFVSIIQVVAGPFGLEESPTTNVDPSTLWTVANGNPNIIPTRHACVANCWR